MNDLSKEIENIILEEVNLLNNKIKGINLLELLKFNILEKIKPLIQKYNFDDAKNFIHQFDTDNDNTAIFIKIIFIDKPSSILNKFLTKDTLLVSLKEKIKIDVLNIEKSKKIESFSIFPLMGVCLSEKTNINFNFLKNCFYLEIISEDKNINVENIEKNTI